MLLTDTLSRLPNLQKDQMLELDTQVGSIMIEEVNNIHTDMLNFSPEKQRQIREETSKGKSLRALAQIIYTGWPDTRQELPTRVQEYWAYRDELAVESGIIFKGCQVLIPEPLQSGILKQLHAAHQGIEKMRHLAHESVYWPKIHRDIEEICKCCTVCQELQLQQPKEPMIMHEKSGKPWAKLDTDLFEAEGRTFLLISDYFSRYPAVIELQRTTTADVADATKKIFSLLGIPREIVSDNGPQYLTKYDEFCTSWGIRHTTSSPRYPQSNGFIERQVRYIKSIIRKCLKSHDDLDMVLLNIRPTPLDAHLPRLAELMFGRPIQTAL